MRQVRVVRAVYGKAGVPKEDREYTIEGTMHPVGTIQEFIDLGLEPIIVRDID